MIGLKKAALVSEHAFPHDKRRCPIRSGACIMRHTLLHRNPSLSKLQPYFLVFRGSFVLLLWYMQPCLFSMYSCHNILRAVMKSESPSRDAEDVKDQISL